jgi:hypothetical protein
MARRPMKPQGIKRNLDPDLVPPEVYRPSEKKASLQDLLKYEGFPSEFCPLNLSERTGHRNMPFDQNFGRIRNVTVTMGRSNYRRNGCRDKQECH